MKTRISISFSEDQKKFLDSLMKEDAQDNISAYIALLIANEFNRRLAEKEKRKRGRPAGDKKDDEECFTEEQENMLQPFRDKYHGGTPGGDDEAYIPDPDAFFPDIDPKLTEIDIVARDHFKNRPSAHQA